MVSATSEDWKSISSIMVDKLLMLTYDAPWREIAHKIEDGTFGVAELYRASSPCRVGWMEHNLLSLIRPWSRDNKA